MDTILLSIIILSRNEAANISRCLKSVLWCTDIILVDDSEDETVKIASQIATINLRVIKTKERNDFSKLRNFAFSLARHDWVLFLDADEVVTPKLAQEIQQAITSKSIQGYYLKRQDYFLGKWLQYGETGGIKHLKLAKKSAGHWTRRVHEILSITGPTATLNAKLLHYPHPTVADFINHINRWTTLDAKEFFSTGKRSSFVKILAYPAAKFIYNYFLKLGWLDGMPGLIMGLLMSFHSFLTRAKLYFLQTDSG